MTSPPPQHHQLPKPAAARSTAVPVCPARPAICASFRSRAPLRDSLGLFPAVRFLELVLGAGTVHSWVLLLLV